MAQSQSAVRAFDESGHVSDDKAPVLVERYHAEVRGECRKRIVGDLGLRSRDPGYQGGLPGVGKANQSDIGEQLEFETEVLLFAVFAGLHLARCAIGGCREMRVAQTAASALRHQHAVARVRQIRDELRLRRQLARAVEHESSHRDGEFQVMAAAARTVGPFAVTAALGRKFRMKAEVDEGVQVRAGDDVDRAAVSAVASAGTAARDIFLSPEGQTAAAAVSCRDVDVYFVDEHLIIWPSGHFVIWSSGRTG